LVRVCCWRLGGRASRWEKNERERVGEASDQGGGGWGGGGSRPPGSVHVAHTTGADAVETTATTGTRGEERVNSVWACLLLD